MGIQELGSWQKWFTREIRQYLPITEKKKSLLLKSITVEYTSHITVTCIMKYGKLSLKFEHDCKKLWSVILIAVCPAL